MNHKIILIVFLFFNIGMNTCFSQDYQTTKEGLKYRFLTASKDGKKAKENYFVKYHLVIQAADTTWRNSYQEGMGGFLGQVRPVQGITDMNGVFRYISEGDSVEAIQNLDSLRKANPQGVPPQLQNEKEAKYIYKILKVFEDEEAIKKHEEQVILEYAKKNNLKTKKTESGLYYSILKENKKGKKAQKGDSIQVHYVGKFLGGKVFDTSREDIAKEAGLYNPKRDYEEGFIFSLGQQQVIKAWDEGCELLREGEKAIFLVPFYLGYGAAGSRSIPPYSTLVFEVELMSANGSKVLAKEAESQKKANYLPLLITLGIVIPIALILIFLFRRPKNK